jgi:DNA ligase (NAD+)
MGKTGILTPVAKIEPVHVSGTMVENVNLFNIDNIRKMDIMIGDFVRIEK